MKSEFDTIKYDSNIAFHWGTWSFSRGISVCCCQVRTMELLECFDSLSTLTLITECAAVTQARLLHHLSLEKHHGYGTHGLLVFSKLKIKIKLK